MSHRTKSNTTTTSNSTSMRAQTTPTSQSRGSAAAQATDGYAAVLSRQEEAELFRRLAACRRQHVGWALQSREGLSQLGELCEELAAAGTLQQAQALATWRSAVQRQQRRAAPWWERFTATDDAVASAELTRELEQIGGRIVGAADRAGVEPDLRQRVATSATAALRSAEADREEGTQTTLLSQRAFELEREIRGIEAHLSAANQGLVCLVLKRYVGLGLGWPDLMQEANIGLMRAIDKFQVERGLRFNTYAVWWIRQAARRALSNQARTIRVPVHTLDARYVVGRASTRLTAQLGRRPTDDELAHETGLPVREIERLATLTQEPISLETPRGAEHEARLIDFIPAPDASDAADVALAGQQRQSCVEDLLNELTPRERTVVRMRFGFENAQEEYTLEMVGQALGVTRERARQIEAKSLSKLRRAAARRNIDIQSLN